LERDRSRKAGPEGPYSARRIGDSLSEQHAHDATEEDHARMTDGIGRKLGPQPARSIHEIGAAGDDRLHQSVELERLVLAVRVDRGDHLGASLACQPVPELEHQPLATVDLDVAHQSTRGGRLFGGRIRRTIHDHDHLSRQTRNLARDLLYHARHGGLLVVGGNHDRHRGARSGRVLRQERGGGGALRRMHLGELGVERGQRR
jgi:hypothetical protein